MSTQGVYGRELSDRFHLEDEAPAFVTSTLKRAEIAVTHLQCRRPNQGLTDPIPIEDAYLVACHSEDCVDHELWVDGKAVKKIPFLKGQTTFYDLRTNPIAYMRSTSNCLMFYLPRSTFDAIADESDAPRIDDLRHPPGVGTDDPIVQALSAAILPAFENPDAISRLYLDHTTLAVATHVAHAYGGLRIDQKPIRGGLSHRNERRAKEIMDANLSGDVPLAMIAAECRMSAGHFARAFRRSVGVAPHRWLVLRRVEVAKDLLRNSAQTIFDIALDCGFADQSHFTRAFTNVAGTSPGAWRRENR
ncbi:helix-turn-helix transcriptional regulator [Bradyrhizobium sp. Pear77]|uniref:helix-turn-helix domain-containing protein n=1 Tax=Bradyrhizobium altum TaxID=1571202 RepID=UPI001E2E0F88|nr:AraC family transcriptional regulator [Bradyrhizobium altum]MCC8954191.1 helix-turn-helix transcriptional regulator [Bradyrhizobium altum]